MTIADSERRGYELLEEAEATLARLYGRYAELFPEDEAFWIRLAADETKHAAWVAAFLTAANAGSVAFKDGRLSIETFTTFLEYLTHRIEEARHGSPTPFQALTIARDIECTMIERSFFEIFTVEGEEDRRLLHALHADTERHRKEIDAEWARRRPAKK